MPQRTQCGDINPRRDLRYTPAVCDMCRTHDMPCGCEGFISYRIYRINISLLQSNIAQKNYYPKKSFSSLFRVVSFLLKCNSHNQRYKTENQSAGHVKVSSEIVPKVALFPCGALVYLAE